MELQWPPCREQTRTAQAHSCRVGGVGRLRPGLPAWGAETTAVWVEPPRPAGVVLPSPRRTRGDWPAAGSLGLVFLPAPALGWSLPVPGTFCALALKPHPPWERASLLPHRVDRGGGCGHWPCLPQPGPAPCPCACSLRALFLLPLSGSGEIHLLNTAAAQDHGQSPGAGRFPSVLKRAVCPQADPSLWALPCRGS